MKLPIEISLEDARFLALKNQKLLERDNHHTKKDLHKIIEKIGYVQIDTISIIERAHHHILWTRLPAYKKSMLDDLMKEKKIFEYWSHAAAFLPMKDYRFSLLRKENYKERYKAWANKNKKIIDFARDRITNEGPLQSKDFEHPPRVKSGWWDWKPAKEALEYLFHAGEFMVAERKNFQKVYDLTERVLTKKIDTTAPSYEEHCEHLIMNSINANGFASQKEMFYLRRGDSKISLSVLNKLVGEKKIIPMKIKGIKDENYYTTKENFKQLKQKDQKKEFTKDVHILSPFDNLVIQRKRLKTLFDFDYVIECYVPAAKRKFGYYVLPILYGNKLIGRLDAKADRGNNLFRIINLWFEDKAKIDNNFKEIFKKRIDELTIFTGCKENNLENFFKVRMDKPIRHSNHILSEKSKKFLNSCLPDEWVVNELKNDYGIDYLVDIVDKNCVTGFSFLIQLKSHHKGNNKDTVSVVINRSTLNFWITKLDPILIIAYVKETNEAYYKWINSNDFDLTQKSKTFSITIDKKNELTKINWEDVKKYIKSISSKRNLLYDNDIDFSSLKDEEKLAVESYFKGNVETALHHFFNILKNSPENPVTLSSIAMCYYKSYDYNKALVYINKALSLLQHKKLYFNKACILVEAGLYNNQYEKLLEAKKIFSENIEDSDNFHIHYSYANALSHIPGEENFLLAEKEFKIALKQNPNYAKAWKNLGSLYFNEGRHEEELKCYTKALLINPNLPEALFSMGMTLHQIFNKNKLGLRFILQAVSILGDKLPLKFPNSYFVVARLLFRIKDYEGCIVWINEGLRNNPGDKDLVNLKIYFYTKFWKKKEHFENAKKFFSESIKYSENILDCIYLLTLIMKFEEKTSEEIYRFIKTHVKKFEQIDFLDLKKFSLSVNDIINTIPYIREYMNFKLVVQDEVFNIPLDTTKILDLPLFLHTFEIICLVVFSKTIIFAKKNLNSKSIESLICDRILSNFFKFNVGISFYLLSKDKISAQDRLIEILIISQSFSYFSAMVASNMIGYILGSFSLNKNNIKLDLIQEFSENLAKKLYIYLNKYIKNNLTSLTE